MGSHSRAATRLVTMNRRAKADALTRLGEAAVPAPPSPEDTVASDSIARNTVFATATTVLTASFAVLLTLYLVRALGPRGYGIYTLALAVGALFALVMDFGISSSAGRFIAERRGDRSGGGPYNPRPPRVEDAVCGGGGGRVFPRPRGGAGP